MKENHYVKIPGLYGDRVDPLSGRIVTRNEAGRLARDNVGGYAALVCDPTTPCPACGGLLGHSFVRAVVGAQFSCFMANDGFKTRLVCSATCSRSIRGKTRMRNNPVLAAKMVEAGAAITRGKKLSDVYDAVTVEKMIKPGRERWKTDNPVWGANADKNLQAAVRSNIRSIGMMTKGKTFDEMYGIELSAKYRSAMSLPGERNPMYGKQPSNLAGRSILKGSLNGIFFRSASELSFLVAFPDAVTHVGKIDFVLNGVKRTYLPDFDRGSDVYEVKPKALIRTDENQAKFAAARVVLGDRFKVVSPVYDFPLVSADKLEMLPGLELINRDVALAEYRKRGIKYLSRV